MDEMKNNKLQIIQHKTGFLILDFILSQGAGFLI